MARFGLSLLAAALPVLGTAASMIPAGAQFSERSGPELYAAICQACHMANAKGSEGAGHYPALAANPNLAASGYILHNVLHGRHGMPGFKDELDDAQVAAVINHVRTHYGNQYTDDVTAEQVAQAR